MSGRSWPDFWTFLPSRNVGWKLPEMLHMQSWRKKVHKSHKHDGRNLNHLNPLHPSALPSDLVASTCTISQTLQHLKGYKVVVAKIRHVFFGQPGLFWSCKLIYNSKMVPVGQLNTWQILHLFLRNQRDRLVWRRFWAQLDLVRKDLVVFKLFGAVRKLRKAMKGVCNLWFPLTIVSLTLILTVLSMKQK